MQQVGPYRITGELGRGGMGVVYRARREGSGHDVALKVIAAGADASPEALARFQREARIATELDHPGIVKVLETGPDGDTVWFAMELVEGEPLSTAVLEREFTWQEAVTIVRDIAEALSVAHGKGVLHRDLKPSNIILDPTGKPHVTDFGLAKDTRTESKYTRTGQTLGTPAYMSPEQARGDLADLTPASDVWALGCVLYELMLNRLAFEGDTAAAIIGAVMSTTPDTAMLPRPVARLADVCLQRDARRRYQDAGALRDDCDRVLNGRTPAASLPSRLGRNLAIGAVSLAVAGGLALLLWQDAAEVEAAQEAIKVAGPSPAERLADRAWDMRHTLPEDAVAGLRDALDLAPGRDDWRIRLGLLLWARNDAEAGRAEWARVPDDSAEKTAAEFYTGLSWYFTQRKFELGSAEAAPVLQRVSQQPGRFAAVAQAALQAASPHHTDALETLRGDESWEACLIRAQALTAGGRDDLSAVQRELERVLEIGLQFSWAWCNLGTAMNGQRNVEGAMRAYDRAIALNADNQWALHSRARLRALQGDLDGAESDFTEVLRIFPAFEEARGERLTLRFNRGQWEKALEDLDQVQVTREVVGDLFRMRAIALYELKRFSESLPAAQLATRAAPASAEAWFVLAKSHWALDAPQPAVQAFREALKHNPTHFGANYQCARLLVGFGRVPESIPLYTAAIAANPNHAGAWADRGVAHRRTRQRDNAIADATRAIELDPKMTRAYVCRGLERMRLKQYDDAVTDLRTADGLQGGRPDVLSALGLCLMMSDQHAAAVGVFEAFLKRWAGRSPMEKDVRTWLAEAKAKAGK